MRRICWICVLAWFAVLLAATGGAVGPAHAQASAPVVVAHAEFPITATDEDATLMNVVVDFPSGASTPDHTHGGPVIALVLDGEITLHASMGMVSKQPAGTFWTEVPGHIHHAANEGGASAQISVVGLVPKGGKLTLSETNSSYTPSVATKTAMQTQFPLGVAAGEAVLTNVIVQFAPGAATPQHVHGGPVLATVLTGIVTVHDPDGIHVYHAGESWTEFPNHPHYAANEGTEVARLSVSSILPKGAALTTPVKSAPAAQVSSAPATLPHTGSADDGMLFWLLASGAAIGIGIWMRRYVVRRRT